MATYTDRESFIPYRRSDIISFCIEDAGWKEDTEFRQFTDLLIAHLHFHYHAKLEEIKEAFAFLNPDADTLARAPRSEEDQLRQETRMIALFEDILQKANYRKLDEKEIQDALAVQSLIPLNTFVDFNDYEPGRILFYYRGLHSETIPHREWIRKKDKTFDTFERVALLIKFKPEFYFKKKKKWKVTNFTPGKMYIYLYKKVPKHDVDILFPNVDVSMGWKDKIKFFVPALGGLIPVLLKALPNLILLVGVILFFTMGPEFSSSWGADEKVVNNFLPVLTALLSLSFIMGGFAVRQYLNYKNKRLKFLKNVTDTLFFKNIDCNQGVIHTLLDAAEEEAGKEILLVYYFLLRHPGMTTQEMDDRIEAWLESKFQAKIDFDVDKAIQHLSTLSMDGQHLLRCDSGRYSVADVHEAKILIDKMWDNAFQYNTVLNAAERST